MSRRDTIIISVLVNSFLLVFLFATATQNKGSSKSFQTQSSQTSDVPSISIEDINKTIAQKESLPKPSFKLNQLEKTKSIEAKTELKAEPEVNKSQPKYVEITVKRGDYLAKIARENNTQTEDIMQLNQLTSTQLRIGQVLKVPALMAQANQKESSVRQYIVKDGDSIWKIANEQKMKEEDLLKLNRMTKEGAKKIKAGDILLIQ